MQPHRQQPTRLRRPCDSPGKNTGMGCHFLLQCMKVKSESEVAQPCPTLRNPMDCSLPGSSVHGIFQARVLEWAAIAFSLAIYKCMKTEIGLPWWLSGEESDCQYRGHGFNPWPRKIPHAKGHLSLWAQLRSPHTVLPKPTHPRARALPQEVTAMKSPHTTTRESPRAAMKTQCSQINK